MDFIVMAHAFDHPSTRRAFVFTPEALGILDKPSPDVQIILQQLVENGHDVIIAHDTMAGEKIAARMVDHGIATHGIAIPNKQDVVDGRFKTALQDITGFLPVEKTLYVDHMPETVSQLQAQGFAAVHAEILSTRDLDTELYNTEQFMLIRNAVQANLTIPHA